MFKSNHHKVSPRVRAWKNIGVFGLLSVVLVAIFAAQVSAQSLNATTSWLGNSYGGTSLTSATPNQHVQDDIMGLYVAPNGACYTNSTWDENGMSDGSYDASIYNTNNSHSLDGYCVDLNYYGRFGGKAITSDGTYLYVAITQNGDDGADSRNNKYGMPDYPPANTVWYAVRRYTLNGTPAPFAGGSGWDGSMRVVAQGTRPASPPNQPYSGSQIAGLAVASGCLYISDPNTNTILQYSLAGGGPAQKPTASFNSNSSLTVGTMIAAASPGGPFLWVNEKYSGGGYVLIAYGLSGGQVAGANLPSSAIIPSALAYNSANNSLYVADAGPGQNIQVFSLNSGTWGTPFGVTGGQFDATQAAIGTVAPGRFNNITGLGIDGSGNLDVAEDETCYFPSAAGSGGSVLESYSLASGSRNWELHGLTFIDCADIDSATGADAYTKDKHFAMNWGSTAPGSEATYAGYTINRFKYPQDLRLHLGQGNASEAWVREFQGQRFLITNNMYASSLGIFRFNASSDGQTAIPSVVFSQGYINPDSSGWPQGEPAANEWIWTYDKDNGPTMNSGTYQSNPDNTFNANSFGWWVDNKMNIWQVLQGPPSGQTYCIREWVCQGLDGVGNPIYSYAHLTTYPIPSASPQQSLQRIEYHAETDTMYLGGYSSAYPYTGIWGVLGTVIYRYDHWSNNPAVHPGYPIVLPYTQSPTAIPASMSITGSYVFVTYSRPNQILVYNADTGAAVGTITPGSAVGGTGSNMPLGVTDIRNGVRAYQLSNGEYEIFNEDDTYGKVVMYRWTPFVQLLNRWKGTGINVENGLACSSIWGGEQSAEWIQEPASLSGAFRLRNRYTNQYLNVSASGALQCTASPPSPASAQWLRQDDVYNDGFVYLGSVADSGQYINNENNPSVPACTTINSGWYSAMWTLNNVNN